MNDNYLRPQCIYIVYSDKKTSHNSNRQSKSVKLKNKYKSKTNIAKCEHIVKGFSEDWQAQMSQSAAELIIQGKFVRDWYWGLL